MITDKDIQKLAKVLAAKEDLSELAADVVRIDENVEKLDQRLNGIDRRLSGIDQKLTQMPTREEFPSLLEKTSGLQF